MIFEKLYTEMFNALCSGTLAKVDTANKLVSDDKIEIDRNIQYGKDDVLNVFDIFYPKDNKNEKLTTIFNVHGGGYVAGAKEQADGYCKLLAQMGYLVVNVEYCNSKFKPFNEAVNEVISALEFMKNDEYISSLVDFDNFFISGDSAGAHIASIVANAKTNSNVGKFFKSVPCSIKGCLFTSPTFRTFKFMNFPYPKHNFENLVFGKKTSNEIKDICDVSDNLTSQFPPTIIFSASTDFINIQAKYFCKNAMKFNFPVEHIIFSSGEKIGHDFTLTYANLKEGKFALKSIDNFIQNIKQNNLQNGVVEKKVNLKKEKFENNEILEFQK